MNNYIEAVASALFTVIQNSIVVTFTASNSLNSPGLAAISSTKGFFVGLPVFGPGVTRGTTIAAFDPVGLTAILSDNITEANTAASFSTGFLDVGRRVKMWGEEQEMPACFLRHTKDKDEYVNTVMQKTSMEFEVWIYSDAGEDPDEVPDITLNNLVTAVRNCLKMDVSGRPQTLNGLVQWARVEGDTVYDPGDIDGVGKALLNVTVLCP